MKLETKDRRVAGLQYPIREGEFGIDIAIDLGIRRIDESRMSCWIPIADGNRRDGVGDLLQIEGIKTDRHCMNPIVLFDHAKECKLPIAKAKDEDGNYTFMGDPVSKTAGLEAFFWQGKDGYTDRIESERYDHAILCEQLFHMYAAGFINGGSIGYQVIQARELPPDYERGTPKGLHLLSILMLEGSLVVLPANMDTVAKALSLPKFCGHTLSPVLVKSLQPYAPKRVVQMGYEGKALGEKDKKSSYLAGFKAKQSFDQWLGGKRSIYSNDETKILESEYLKGRNDRKKKKKVEGESWFEICPRDENGRCLPKDEVVDKRKEAPIRTKPDKEKETREEKEQEERDSQKNLTVRVPLDENLNEGSVPPAKWKPGKGAIKGKKSMGIKKVSGPRHPSQPSLSHFTPKPSVSTQGEMTNIPDWVKEDIVEPPLAKPIVPKTTQPAKPAKPASKKPKTPKKTRGSNVPDWVKEGQNIPDWMKKIKSIRDKYRTTKGRKKTLRKSLAGTSLVYVSSKNLSKARKFAEAKGLKFHHLGRHADGSERIKLIGGDDAMDDVAKSFGLLIGSYRQKSEPSKKGRFMGTKRTKALGDPPMEEEIETIADEGGDELVVNIEDATTGSEPYGAQVLRKMHEDFSMLMQEYDDMMGPLENEVVRQCLTKKLQEMERSLSEWEKMFSKVYPDLQGMVDTKELDDGDDDGDDDDEDVEEEFDDEKAMDQEAMPADSVDDEREEEEPDADEVIEGMDVKALKIPTKIKMKYLRSRYKSLCPKCKAMGKKTCHCGTKALNDRVNKQEDFNPQAINPDVYPEESEGDREELFGDQEKETVKEAMEYLEEIGKPDSQFSDEHRMKAYHFHKTFAKMAPLVAGAIGMGVGSAMGGKEIDGQTEVMEEETETKGCKACQEASRWFEELSRTRDFGDNHREKSAGWYKQLKELVADEVEEETEDFTDEANDEVQDVVAEDEVNNGDIVDADFEEEEVGEISEKARQIPFFTDDDEYRGPHDYLQHGDEIGSYRNPRKAPSEQGSWKNPKWHKVRAEHGAVAEKVPEGTPFKGRKTANRKNPPKAYVPGSQERIRSSTDELTGEGPGSRPLEIPKRATRKVPKKSIKSLDDIFIMQQKEIAVLADRMNRLGTLIR